MSGKARTVLGRLLLKAAPEKFGNDNLVGPARRDLTERSARLRLEAESLPFAAIARQLVADLAAVASAEQVVDRLPDAAARWDEVKRLDQLQDGVRARIDQARTRVAEHRQLLDQLAAARIAIAAEPASPGKTARSATLAKLDQGLALVAGVDTPQKLGAITQLLAAARQLGSDGAKAEAGQAAYRRATVELPALRQRCRAAEALDASSPALQALRTAMQAAERALPSAVSVDDAEEALRLMGVLAIAVAKVEAQAASEAAACRAALAAARSARGALVAPVLGGDLAAIDAALAAAAQRAAAGGRHPAMADLAAVEADCRRVAALAAAYDQALAAAKAALLAARPKMLDGDIDGVQKDMIDAAQARAAAGQRQAAHDLLARVAPHCTAAAAANLRARYTPGTWAPDFAPLASHAQRAAFAAEIAGLGQALASAKALMLAGATTAATKEMTRLHHEARKQRAFADRHQLFAAARDPVARRLEQLRLAPPVASNAGIAAELTALDALVSRAADQAGKRRYDEAQRGLTEADAAIVAATARKRDHAAYAQALATAGPRVQALAFEPGTPAAADAAAARASLQDALTTAASTGDPAAALVLLQRAERQCDACSAGQAARDAGTRSRDAALAGLDTDTAGALHELRQWLGRLKTGPGQDAIRTDLADIERLLAEADAALAP